MRFIARFLRRLATFLDGRFASYLEPRIHVDVNVPSSFTPRELACIANAVAIWERLTMGEATWHLYVIYDDHPRQTSNTTFITTISKGTSSDTWVTEWDEANKSPTLVGLCCGDPTTRRTDIWLVIDRLTKDELLTWTVAHEIGHTMGLHHVSDISSIMSSTYNWSYTPSEHDMVEFKRSLNTFVALGLCNPKPCSCNVPCDAGR